MRGNSAALPKAGSRSYSNIAELEIYTKSLPINSNGFEHQSSEQVVEKVLMQYCDAGA
jgi:hypothetical protein